MFAIFPSFRDISDEEWESAKPQIREFQPKQHVGKQEAPFPVFADPHAEIYDRYGVEVSEDKFQATVEDADTPSYIAEAAAAGFVLQHQEGANMHRVPAEFLIDESGTIQIAHYGRLMTDHLSLEVIDHFARGTENDQL